MSISRQATFTRLKSMKYTVEVTADDPRRNQNLAAPTKSANPSEVTSEWSFLSSMLPNPQQTPSSGPHKLTQWAEGRGVPYGQSCSCFVQQVELPCRTRSGFHGTERGV
jgi:hypothetical protein